MHILSPETDNCPSWISGRERMTVENISWSISAKECCRPWRGLYPRPPGLQSDGASNWATEAGMINYDWTAENNNDIFFTALWQNLCKSQNDAYIFILLLDLAGIDTLIVWIEILAKGFFFYYFIFIFIFKANIDFKPKHLCKPRQNVFFFSGRNNWHSDL